MVPKNVRRSALLSLSALVVVACLPNTRSRVTRQMHPPSRYTAPQVLQLAQPICNAIAPRSGNLTLTIESSAAVGPNHTTQPLWLVDGKDNEGEIVAHLTYDANTGELISAGHPVAPAVARSQAIMDRQEAERWGRSWLQVLGVAHPGSDWRLVRAKKWREGDWSLSWKWGNRTAYVILDGHTGELVVGGCSSLEPTRRNPSRMFVS